MASLSYVYNVVYTYILRFSKVVWWRTVADLVAEQEVSPYLFIYLFI